MSVSAGRRTWEEASSPAAVRLTRAYEQAWRESDGRKHRPDPRAFLDSAGASIDEAGARLAVLRADLSLRWEGGERLGARWYLDRYPDLSEDTIVALVYEEFCLREEDGEDPDPARFLDRFPEVAPALRRVLDIHGLVGSGSTRGGASLLAPTGSGEHACAFPETGQTISGFFLVEELGRGSFARVFLARERELADRPVALKVTRRGSREPQTLARLQHTHIVPVHSHRIDRATGLHLLCMPYFGRTTLAQVLAAARQAGIRSGAGLVDTLERLEPSEAPAAPSSGRAALERRSYDRAVAWWGSRLAEALEHAHDRGVLHRDIKPSNVLVTSDGMPMLLDFNLAREPVDQEGGPGDSAPGGTVDYMAPEHLRALAVGDPEGLDHRSDIYSLGVVLFEALTGGRPFSAPRRGTSIADALHRAADERAAARPRPRTIEPQIPPALDAVVRRCLEPDPAVRYASAGQLAEDLRAVADDLPLAHAREPLVSRAGGWLRRKRLKLAVAAALTLALLIVTGTALVAYIGYLLMKENDSRLIGTKLDQAMQAYDDSDYHRAKYLFETVNDLANRLDRLDPRKYPAEGHDALDTARTIVQRLRGLSDVRDLDDMRALARDKGRVAARYAAVYADADALQAAASRLRFELLLHLKDLPSIWRELRQALEPFYVLESNDWTALPHQFGMLDPKRGDEVRQDVDGLLFLWVKAVAERLAEEGPSAEGSESRENSRRIVREAMEICRRAGGFAESKAPWLALHAYLGHLDRGGDPARSREPAAARFGPEPADVAAEPSPLACFEWAQLHFPDDDLARSIAWMRRAVRLRGEDYWYQYFLGYLEDLAGHPDEALEHYSIAAALQPRSPFVRYSRARLYRSKGRWDEAFIDFGHALDGLGDRREARMIWLERGVLYQMMGDYARARADFAMVTRRDPNDEYGRAARVNRADIDAESGEFNRARAEYDALIGEDPRDEVARHSRAILELRMGQAVLADRDLSALLALPDIKPRDRVEYLVERAQARLLLGRAPEAVADALEARRVRRTPAHDRLAQRALLAAGRYAELRFDRPEDLALLPLRGPRLDSELRAAAAALARIAAGADGNAFRAGLTRAVILAALKNPREALAAANRAVAASAFSAEALLIRARVLSALGDRTRARSEVERCLVFHRDHPGLFELRGSLRLAAGDPRGAIEDFDRAASLGARDGIHIGKASALMALGAHRAALDEWSLALRQDPELPEAFLGRAQAHFRLREWDLGLADLEQATAWAHADPRIEAAAALGYLQCGLERSDRLPRLLVHAGRALDGFWHSLDGRYRLAAGSD